jgi:hypothetical protein
MKDETRLNDVRLKQLLAVIIAIIIAFVLFGCSVDKKAKKKVSWLLAHDKMDDACSRLYPNIDSISKGDTTVVYDTLYKDGPEIYLKDAIYQRGDTIIKVITKQCPKVPVVTKTVHDSVFIYRTNTAEVERWKGEVITKDGQIKAKDDIIIKQQQKIDSMDKWRLWCIITWSLIVLGFVVRVFVIKRPI